MRKLFIALLVSTLPLLASERPLQTNVLIPGEGDTQISSEFDLYQNFVEGAPIKGSVLITHDSTNPVDINSFRMGDTPLKVDFVQSTPMSSYGKLEVSVYRFELNGLKNGSYPLPPITVKVGSKTYEAPPLTVDIGPGNS